MEANRSRTSENAGTEFFVVCLKEHVRALAENEYGHVVLMAALGVVDDTALLRKMICAPLQVGKHMLVARCIFRLPVCPTASSTSFICANSESEAACFANGNVISRILYHHTDENQLP